MNLCKRQAARSFARARHWFMMPRDNYQIAYTTDFRELFTELNRTFAGIAEALARLEGLDGFTPTFAANVDLGGHRVTNVGRSRGPDDVPTRSELVEQGLFRQTEDDVHTAVGLIDAKGGVRVPSTPPDSSTSGGGGVGSHGALLNLGADDHTQYFRADGTRALTGPLDHDGTTVGFYTTTPATQAAAAANLTDSSGGTANDTVQALTDPADAPATADVLRDDLVANLIPELRNNYADLVAKVNKALTVLRTVGLMAT